MSIAFDQNLRFPSFRWSPSIRINVEICIIRYDSLQKNRGRRGKIGAFVKDFDRWRVQLDPGERASLLYIQDYQGSLEES